MSNLPPINKTPTTAQLISGVEQVRAEKVASLAKLVGLTLGNNLLASVERVEPIDPQQRDQLLRRTQEVLMQLQRLPLTPAIKAQIQQLTEQQQLLQSPQVKLAQLLVNGKPLIVYSDRPMTAGQSLMVQLTDSQRLVWLSQPNASGLNPAVKPAPDVGAQRIAADFLVNLSRPGATSPLQTLRDISQPGSNLPAAASQSPRNSDLRLLLAEALRTLLPQQDQPRELFSALPQLQQLSASQRQWLPPSLQQALKAAADQLRTPDQLSNPRLLQLALKNSGVFFEHKLATRLAEAAGPIAKGATEKQTGNVGPQATEAQILTNRLTTQDLKGALLQLIHQTRVALGSDAALVLTPGKGEARAGSQEAGSSPVTTSNSTGATPASELLAKSLPSLLHLLQLLPQKPPQELNGKQLRTQLLMLLHQQALSSLARVQMQQVHSLNHQQGQSDSAQPSQSWIFELPVRIGHEAHYLELRLQQDWVEEKTGQDEDSPTEKKRQWTVHLSFDLPEAGPFHAQLQVVDESVSARFWAERETTLDRVRTQLEGLRQQLESEGISVTQLQCQAGKPVNQRMSINYSLVDITT